jgi:hypothetical protein
VSATLPTQLAVRDAGHRTRTDTVHLLLARCLRADTVTFGSGTILKPFAAGVGSTLPRASTARTAKLWGPIGRTGVRNGDAQVNHAWPSTLHWKVAFEMLAWKVWATEREVVAVGGALSIAVSGVGAAIVKLACAGVGSVWPAASIARTPRSCVPFGSGGPKVVPGVQAAKAPPSTEHWKVEPVSLEALREVVELRSRVGGVQAPVARGAHAGGPAEHEPGVAGREDVVRRDQPAIPVLIPLDLHVEDLIAGVGTARALRERGEPLVEQERLEVLREAGHEVAVGVVDTDLAIDELYVVGRSDRARRIRWGEPGPVRVARRGEAAERARSGRLRPRRGRPPPRWGRQRRCRDAASPARDPAASAGCGETST